MKRSIYPKGFLWGASTSSHQIEGGTHNQWSEWELANAKRLAKNAPKKYAHLPNWPEIKSQATDPANYISGNGIDHYNRYREDFVLLKDLNLNAFRFGVEWSRVEPQEGQWDENAIQHYREYIATLRKMGIEPILNLWHWAMPVWFCDRGGFAKRRNVTYFERFVAKMSEELGTQVTYVITLNEPNVYTAFGYGTGDWPPQDKSLLKTLLVYGNLVRAHKRAHKAWKVQWPQAQVGAAPNFGNSKPLNRNPLARLAAGLANYIWDWWFLDRIKHQLDFVGLNFYHTNYYTARFTPLNPPTPLNDLGWYMEPRAIGPLLHKTWRRYKLPIIITESGLADAHDAHREWWITETLQTMENAMQKGVNIRGYLHWSLLDNFEWTDGWWPKFGLVAVDRGTMKRTVRPSARWFATEIKKRISR